MSIISDTAGYTRCSGDSRPQALMPSSKGTKFALQPSDDSGTKLPQFSEDSNANYLTKFYIELFNADDVNYIGDAEVDTIGAYLGGMPIVTSGFHLLRMD